MSWVKKLWYKLKDTLYFKFFSYKIVITPKNKEEPDLFFKILT